MSFPDFDNLENPSDDFFAAMGKAINRWSIAEFMMTSALCSLITETGDLPDGDVTPAVITLGMSSSTTIGLMKTLVQNKFPDDAKEFGKLCDGLLKSKKFRDTMAHSIWGKNHKTDKYQPFLAKTMNGMRAITVQIKLKDIEDYIDTVNKQQLMLMSFRARWGLIPSFPDKDG